MFNRTRGWVGLRQRPASVIQFTHAFQGGRSKWMQGFHFFEANGL